MNPDSAPRLNKWIFLGIDGLLLVIAFAIVYLADNPYAPLPFVSAICLVALAAIIGLVPFLIDFAAENADYVNAERARIAEQAQRLQATIDSLGRATAQIKAVEEAVHKSAREAETLPYRMQEKLAEFNEALAGREAEDREALETELEELRAANSDRLKTIAEMIHASTTEFASIEAGARKQLAAAQEAVAKLQAEIAGSSRDFDERAGAALERFETKSAALLGQISAAADKLHTAATSATSAPRAEPISPPPSVEIAPTEICHAASETVAPPLAESTPHPVPAPEIVTEIAMIDATPTADAADLTKPRKVRTPRKAKPDDVLAEMPNDSVASTEERVPAIGTLTVEDLVPTPDPETPGDPAAGAGAAEASTSSDGATRLLATAYIGIGNKLFIRGDGPGLTWDTGVPMQFVSIGKWGWSTQESVTPIRCKLYKNDDLASLTGEIVLEPGRHMEVTALF